ncbi:retrovirus-related pol polyprotein from transposon tnt 1-94 [Cucumis melo var. makuwa]|uniref:Retrovirus-related pol polyprotein from transposon tnt 1-94 n=1 Tax=Cucumis melo var. makuwa TaxID=1194695 RepID=A0A5D3BYR3_CUCMM|nr:retrovirus-related pol polyprotein from transposon tnt 1-94 [Cucumis melo var. makuwa]
MKILMNQQGLLIKLVPHQELMEPTRQVVIPDDGVEDLLFYKQNTKKNLLPFRHEVHFSRNNVLRYVKKEIHIRISVHSKGEDLVWRSIKQGCIADSTMEVEYIATCEAVWLKKFLHDLEVVPNMNMSITLYCNNSGVVANSKESRSHKREKHVERMYRISRENMQRGDVIITKITLEHNIANPFTKTLMTKVFKRHLESLAEAIRKPDASIWPSRILPASRQSAPRCTPT